MLEKSHRRPSKSVRRSHGLLEFLRRSVAQRRVQPEAILGLVDEALPVRA